LWNLGHDFSLRENNLNGGPYINQWTLSNQVHGKTFTVSQLTALPNYLVYSGHHQVIIKTATYTPSLFTILPPTSKATWSQFVKKTAPYRQGKNPYDLASWLKDFPGKEVTGVGTIQNIVETTKGFTLTVTGTNEKVWTRLLAPPSLSKASSTSTVILSYTLATHQWSLISAIPSPISARITPSSSITPDLPHVIGVSVTNSAPYIQQGTLTVAINNQTISNTFLKLKADEHVTNSVDWTPASSGTDHVTIMFNHQRILEQPLQITPLSRPSSWLLWGESFPLPGTSMIVLILTLAVGGLTLVLWRRSA
jgi:hypothetical protein